MNEGQPHQKHEYILTSFQRHSILVVCFLLYMVNFMDRQVLSVVMEPMKLDLGLTDTQAGMLQSGFFLSMAFFAFPAAYLVDRWSRRKSLAIMAIVWSGFTYITGLGKSFTGVLLPRMLVGIGEAGFAPGGTAMISAAYPQEARSRVLGLFNASIPLGAALGTILGGYIAGRTGEWRTPFLIFAVPGIILGVVTLFLKDYKTTVVIDDTGRKKGFFSSVASLIKIPTLRLVYIGYAMQLAMTMAFIVWAPAFIMRAQGIQVEKAGVIVGAIGLLGILGAPLGGIAADLWQKKNPRGRLYVALITVWLGAIMMALTILFELRGLGLVFGLLWGILAVAGTPAVNSISQDVVTPGIKGLSWGMAGFIAMLGGAAWAPSVVGAVSDSLGGGAYGLKAALTGITACGIVAGLMFLLASKHYPRDLEKVKGLQLEAEK